MQVSLDAQAPHTARVCVGSIQTQSLSPSTSGMSHSSARRTGAESWMTPSSSPNADY